MDKTVWDQWRHFRGRFPQVLLLLKMDDQYIAMGDDARVLAKLFGVTPTSFGADDQGPLLMAALPDGDLNENLKVLLKAGHRVGLCEKITKAPEGEAVERVLMDDRLVGGPENS